jgi:hypothetical protein
MRWLSKRCGVYTIVDAVAQEEMWCLYNSCCGGSGRDVVSTIVDVVAQEEMWCLQ